MKNDLQCDICGLLENNNSNNQCQACFVEKKYHKQCDNNNNNNTNPQCICESKLVFIPSQNCYKDNLLQYLWENH